MRIKSYHLYEIRWSVVSLPFPTLSTHVRSAVPLRTAAPFSLEAIMPRCNILTDRQRAVLFHLPTDEAALLRHYTLADDDLEIIRARRRPHNRFGFALQLCALRYPGRLLALGEVIPEALARFLAAQLGLRPDDLADYETREETRREHLAALWEVYGFEMFTGRGSRDLKAWLEDAAETARSNKDLARSFVEYSRATRTILPGVTVIERLCADALVAAERRIDDRLGGRLDGATRDRLDALRRCRRERQSICLAAPI